MPRTKSKILDRKGRRNSSCIDLKSISSSIDLIRLQNEQTLLYRNASLFSSRRLFVDTSCEAGRLVLNRVGSLDLTTEFRPVCASSPFSSAYESLKPSEEIFSSCCSLADDNRKEFDFDKMDSTLSQSSDEYSDDGYCLAFPAKTFLISSTIKSFKINLNLILIEKHRGSKQTKLAPPSDFNNHPVSYSRCPSHHLLTSTLISAFFFKIKLMKKIKKRGQLAKKQ